MRVKSLLALTVFAAMTAACGSGSNNASAPTPVPTASTGTLEVRINGAGSMSSSGYTVAIDGGSGQTTTTGTIAFPNLVAGSHSVMLSGFAANCRVDGENPRTVNVTAGATATIQYELLCSTSSPADPN